MQEKLRHLFLFCLLTMSVACTQAQDTADQPAPSAFGKIKSTVVDVCKDAFEALQTPLKDLNIKRDPIPHVLETCAQNPYAMPQAPYCYNIDSEIALLDGVLGEDMEPAPLPWLIKPKTKTEMVKQGIKKGVEQVPEFAKGQAIGMVQSKVNVIPFRGVVRKVTGAEKHANAVANAYEAGKLRRAFLKGLRRAYDCPSSLNGAQ